MKTKGITIIELLISMAIISVLIIAVLHVFIPISQNIALDTKDMRNYKQLLFATMFLDQLYRQSEAVNVDGSVIIFQGEVNNVVCNVQEQVFLCSNRPLLYLQDFGTTSISIHKNDVRYIVLQIGKWSVRFGIFPNIFLI